MKNRIISLFVLSFFVFSLACQVIVFSAESDSKKPDMVYFEDIAGEDYEQTVRALASIGIINGFSETEFAPDEFTTRSQMASLVLRILGCGNVSDMGDAVFSDVLPSHDNYNNIMMAYKLGIINGTGNGLFEPDLSVTYGEAVKMVVCALGYTPMAESMGGYPGGYIAAATQTGLLKTVSVADFEDFIPRSDTALIFYEALTTDIMEYKSYGTEPDYGITGGKTPMTAYLDFKYTEGILTDNGISSLTGNSLISDDRVKIGEYVMNTYALGAEKYLGYMVQAYYKELRENVYELYLCMPEDEETNVLSIESDDIDSIQNISNLSVSISYYLDNKNHVNVKHVSSEYIIYNGKAVKLSDLPANFFNDTKQCDLKLINNDVDSAYDVLIMQRYESYRVKRVDINNDYIYYDDGTRIMSLNLSSDSTDSSFTIFDSKMNERDISYVKIDDVISVFESYDSKIITICISRKSTEGIIDSVTDNNEYIVGDASYELIENYVSDIPAPGGEYELFLDFKDNITYVQQITVAGGNYALLMNASAIRRSGIDAYPQIRVLKSDGKYETLECETELKAVDPLNPASVTTIDYYNLICNDDVNEGYTNTGKYYLWYTDNDKNFTYDIRYSGSDYAYNRGFYYRPWLSDYEKSDIASRKVIYYKLNSKGRVCELIVPDYKDSSTPINSSERKLTMLNTNNGYGVTYRDETNVALDEVNMEVIRISPQATVFAGLAVDYSEKDYHVPENGVYFINNGQVNKMYLYSTDDDEIADVILRYYHLPYESRGNLETVVVTSVSETLEGEIKLRGFSQGREYENVIQNDTRLIQRNLCIASDGSGKITAQNIEEATKIRWVNMGLDPEDKKGLATRYDMQYLYDVYSTMTYPYAGPDSIYPGDILLVGTNGYADICYVEVLMRASDCIIEPTDDSTDYVDKYLNAYGYNKGFVTGFEDSRTKIKIIGSVEQYNLRRGTSADINYKLRPTKIGNRWEYSITSYAVAYSPSSGGLFNMIEPFFCETHEYETLYSQCVVWEYDYKRKTAKIVDGSALKEGDSVVIRGSTSSPREIIILKNNPNDASYAYWNNIPERLR